MLADYLERIYSKEMSFYLNAYKNSKRWKGESLKNKTIIIYCEGEDSDIIKTIKYFNLFDCKVLIHCEEKYNKLFDYIGNFECFNYKELPNHDFHVLSSSLEFLFHKKDIQSLNIPKITLLENNNVIKVGNTCENSFPFYSTNQFFKIPNVEYFTLRSFSNIELNYYKKECVNLTIHCLDTKDMFDWFVNINSLNFLICNYGFELEIAELLDKQSFCFSDPQYNYKKVSWLNQNEINQLIEDLICYSELFTYNFD